MFGLIFGVLFAAILGFGAFVFTNAAKKKKSTPRTVGIVIVLIGVIGLATLPMSFHTVEAGEIAVVKHLGEAKNVRTAGTYFDFWLTENYTYYDAKVQNMEIKAQAYSKDAQTMDISMTVQYKIDTSKALTIANEYGSIEVLANRIESIATEKAKAFLSQSSAMSIIETRLTISPDVEKIIINAVNEDLTLFHAVYTGGAVEHGALAGTVTANDGDEFTGIQMKVQVVQRSLFVNGAGVEGFIDVFQFKHDPSPFRRCVFYGQGRTDFSNRGSPGTVQPAGRKSASAGWY